MITILNTSILTAYGSYTYKQVTLEEAKESLYVVTPCPYCIDGIRAWDGGLGCAECTHKGYNKIVSFLSAIGHQATADVLTELLGTPIFVNRIQYTQQEGEVALVFKLKARAPEGVILSKEEIEAIGYEFGFLTRLCEEEESE